MSGAGCQLARAPPCAPARCEQRCGVNRAKGVKGVKGAKEGVKDVKGVKGQDKGVKGQVKGGVFRVTC